MPAEVERARRLFTRKEYHCMGDAGILKPTERVELIHGEIIEMSPIGPRHVAFVNNLTQLLVTRLAGRAIVSVQNPVALDDDTEPEPDLAILRRRGAVPYKESEPATEDVLLLIEVGDTSLAYDRAHQAPPLRRGGHPGVLGGGRLRRGRRDPSRARARGLRRDAAPDRRRDRQPSGVPGHDPAARGDLRVGDFNRQAPGVTTAGREAQHAHGVRGEAVLEPPALERAAVLANVHRARVLERVDRRDVRAIDLGHGDLARQRGAAEVDSGGDVAVAVAVHDGERDRRPAASVVADASRSVNGPRSDTWWTRPAPSSPAPERRS